MKEWEHLRKDTIHDRVNKRNSCGTQLSTKEKTLCTNPFDLSFFHFGFKCAKREHHIYEKNDVENKNRKKNSNLHKIQCDNGHSAYFVWFDNIAGAHINHITE